MTENKKRLPKVTEKECEWPTPFCLPPVAARSRHSRLKNDSPYASARLINAQNEGLKPPTTYHKNDLEHEFLVSSVEAHGPGVLSESFIRLMPKLQSGVRPCGFRGSDSRDLFFQHFSYV